MKTINKIKKAIIFYGTGKYRLFEKSLFIETIAKFVSPSRLIEFLKLVFVVFMVENDLYPVALVLGNVRNIYFNI